MNFELRTSKIYNPVIVLLGVISLCLIPACAHAPSTITRFDNQPSKSGKHFKPVQADRIGIYRVAFPFEPFSEIGLITFKTDCLVLSDIFRQLRKDSAAQGAEAVVGVKIKGETHTETETVRKCSPKVVCAPDGICTTADECKDETVEKEVSTYTVEGSMIRKKL